MSTPPFRFGIVAARTGGGAAWVEMARHLESSGVATLLVPDRLTSILAPIPALAAAAAATSTLRLGTYVLATGRHPAAQIAHDSATLDFLSGGRFELGLGTGVSAEDFVRAGCHSARRARGSADLPRRLRRFAVSGRSFVRVGRSTTPRRSSFPARRS